MNENKIFRNDHQVRKIKKMLKGEQIAPGGFTI